MIKKVIVVGILCLLGLSSCKQESINTTKQNIAIISPSPTSSYTQSMEINDTDSIYTELIDYLCQQIPELKDYEEYVAKKLKGQASFYIDWGYTEKPPLKEVYDNDGKYLGKFYLIDVGEHWSDHTIPWDSFYIKEDLDKVLWYDVNTSEVNVLSDWRNGSAYKSRQEALGKDN